MVVLSAEYIIQCIMYIIQCTVYNEYYTVYSVHYTCILYTLQCILYNVFKGVQLHCIVTMYNMQSKTICTLYTVHYSLYSVHYTLYSVHYTVYIISRLLFGSKSSVYSESTITPIDSVFIHLMSSHFRCETLSLLLTGGDVVTRDVIPRDVNSFIG